MAQHQNTTKSKSLQGHQEKGTNIAKTKNNIWQKKQGKKGMENKAYTVEVCLIISY